MGFITSSPLSLNNKGEFVLLRNRVHLLSTSHAGVYQVGSQDLDVKASVLYMCRTDPLVYKPFSS